MSKKVVTPSLSSSQKTQLQSSLFSLVPLPTDFLASKFMMDFNSLSKTDKDLISDAVAGYQTIIKDNVKYPLNTLYQNYIDLGFTNTNGADLSTTDTWRESLAKALIIANLVKKEAKPSKPKTITSIAERATSGGDREVIQPPSLDAQYYTISKGKSCASGYSIQTFDTYSRCSNTKPPQQGAGSIESRPKPIKVKS